MKYAKLFPAYVLKGSHRYLLSFLNYRKNPHSFLDLVGGKGNVMSNKAKFQNSKFSLIKYLSCPVLSQNSKNVTFLTTTKINTYQKCIKKVITSTFPGFSAIAKTKIIFWNFDTLVPGIHLHNKYNFLDKFNILNFIGIYCWKNERWDSKQKNPKVRDSHAVKRHIFWLFGSRFYFKGVNSRSFRIFSIF